MQDDLAGLIKAMGRLESDLQPFKDKIVGSIRIDLSEVRSICGAAIALETLTRENAELRNMRVLLPPASIDDQTYLDGWCEGQSYLILNYREYGQFERAISDTDAITSLRTQLTATQARLGEAVRLLSGVIDVVGDEMMDGYVENSLHKDDVDPIRAFIAQQEGRSNG